MKLDYEANYRQMESVVVEAVNRCPDHLFDYYADPSPGYGELNTGRVWTQAEDRLLPDNAPKEMNVLPVLLFSDESYRGSVGDHSISAWVVHLGNFKLEFANKDDARTCLGYQPSARLSDAEKRTAAGLGCGCVCVHSFWQGNRSTHSIASNKIGKRHMAEFMYHCTRPILADLARLMKDHVAYFKGGSLRIGVPYLHMMMADGKEASSMCHVRTGGTKRYSVLRAWILWLILLTFVAIGK